jgi:lauroyl/myristoyl acyltransferase
MQIITSIVDGWVREHPEQWLWLHRRWRYGSRNGGVWTRRSRVS